jgi:predicted MFS family arabinose efflux permease
MVYCVIALFFLPRGRVKPVPAAAEATHEGAEGVVGAEPAPVEKEPRSGYLDVLADHKYVLYLLGFLLMHLVYTQYIASLPLAVKAAGVSTWWYGAVITINGALIVTCEVWATKFVQNWPLRVAQLFGYGLLAAGYAVYAIDMTPLFLVIGTLLWTLSEIMGAPTIWSYPGMVAPARLRGRYFGAQHSTASLGSTVGPILGILLFEHVGQRVFVWAAVVGVVATVVGRLGMHARIAEPAPEPDAEEEIAEPAAI